MPHHLLCDIDGKVLLAVMNHKFDTEGNKNGLERNLKVVRGRPRTYTNPIKLGRMVHALAIVLTGVLDANACCRFGKATKYGPV